MEDTIEGHENAHVYIVRFENRRPNGRRGNKRGVDNRLAPEALLSLQEKHGLYPIQWGEIPEGTPVNIKVKVDGGEREVTYAQNDDVPYIRFFNPDGQEKLHVISEHFGKIMSSVDTETLGKDYVIKDVGDIISKRVGPHMFFSNPYGVAYAGNFSEYM